MRVGFWSYSFYTPFRKNWGGGVVAEFATIVAIAPFIFSPYLIKFRRNCIKNLLIFKLNIKNYFLIRIKKQFFLFEFKIFYLILWVFNG